MFECSATLWILTVALGQLEIIAFYIRIISIAGAQSWTVVVYVREVSRCCDKVRVLDVLDAWVGYGQGSTLKFGTCDHVKPLLLLTIDRGQ